MFTLPYVVNGSVVFIPFDKLPPSGTGHVIHYSSNYLHR